MSLLYPFYLPSLSLLSLSFSFLYFLHLLLISSLSPFYIPSTSPRIGSLGALFHVSTSPFYLVSISLLSPPLVLLYPFYTWATRPPCLVRPRAMGPRPGPPPSARLYTWAARFASSPTVTAVTIVSLLWCNSKIQNWKSGVV